MEAGLQEHPAGVGQRAARGRQLGGGGLEGGELLRIGRAVRLVRAGQVAHQQGERRVLEEGRVGDEAVDIGRRQAEARHAAVDLQGDGQRPAEAFGQRAPQAGLLQAVDHRNDAGLGAGSLGAGLQAVEHIEPRVAGQMRLERQGLGQVGDEEVQTAGGLQSRGGAVGPEAVGVGLDHGGDGAGAEARAEAAVVGDQGAEVDGQAPARRSLKDVACHRRIPAWDEV